jgi:hypothetical protein
VSRTIRRLALLTVLVLLVMGAVGASATDGRAATNKLTGCRNTTTGTLDQVKAGLLPMGGACAAGEVAVTWNKTGPRGPQGPTRATGAPGVAGTPGAPGVAGTPGANGVSGWETFTFTSTPSNIPNKTALLNCPTLGKKLVGGGGSVNDPATHMIYNGPLDSDTWQVVATAEPHNFTGAWTISIWVICVTALP